MNFEKNEFIFLKKLIYRIKQLSFGFEPYISLEEHGFSKDTPLDIIAKKEIELGFVELIFSEKK